MAQSVKISRETYEHLVKISEAKEDIYDLVKTFKIHPEQFCAFIDECGLENSAGAQALLRAAIDLMTHDSLDAHSKNTSAIVEPGVEKAQAVRLARQESAIRMWQIAAEKQGTAFDFWSAAKKYVNSATGSMVITAKHVSPRDEDLVHLRETLLSSRYFDRTRDLAYHMWIESGQLPGTTLAHFWSSAARHVSAIVIGAARTADSPVEALNALANTLDSFHPMAHLRKIRDMAYFHWIERGKPLWDAMKDWVTVENQALGNLVQGQSIGYSSR